MNRVVVHCIAILSLFGTCAAQQLHPCRFSGTSDIGHVEGITVKRLTVMEKSGKVGATVFIPDGNEPLPSIVFSHSVIHGPNNDADLLRFAWALARAGAASIVLDGVINWQSGPNDDSIRQPEFQFCARQWMFQNFNVDLRRTADAGNQNGRIDKDANGCGVEPSENRRCWPGGVWLDFGQTVLRDSASHTDDMLTLEGQMAMAQVLQWHLKLRKIKPEWFKETAQPLAW